MSRILGLLPALTVALFGIWCGSFPGGATWTGAAAGQALLLALSLLAAGEAFDPLRLGRSGRLLPLALWLSLLASLAASPVPRAGRLTALLLPAFFLLPAAFARCWRQERLRTWGLAGVSLAVAGVAGWSLIDRFMNGSPRAAMPLGHHGLLALWLVTLVPFPTLALLRGPGIQRLMGGVGGLLGVAAIVESGSRLGLAALAAMALLAARRLPRAGTLLAGLALLGLAWQVPRLEAALRGRDPSASARLVYWRGGVAGLAERPVLGWGPTATAWTLANHLDPQPGVTPAGEIVSDLHNLPLAVAYELGSGGLLLVLGLGAAFVAARSRERQGAADPELMSAGLIGLAGFAVAALGTATLGASAIPIAVALAAGAALAGGKTAPDPEVMAPVPRATSAPPPRRDWSKLAKVGFLAAYLVAAGALLVPSGLAHRHYERARVAGAPDQAIRELQVAVRLDPSFPLYRARSAWLPGSGLQAERAREALAAAGAADGVASLWLAAGALGREAGAPWSAAALRRATALDPLSPMAPFQRLLAAPDDPEAPACGARALAAAPRLAAALFWERRPDLFAVALARLAETAAIDRGWRAAMVESARGLPRRRGAAVDLALTLDGEPSLSLSLFAFRRSPWRGSLAPVPLRSSALAGLDLPAATALPTTPRSAVRALGCGG